MTSLAGGGFLLQASEPNSVLTPEDFTDEHRAIARTTEEFWSQEVVPNLERIQHQEPGVAASVLRRSAKAGLLAVLVPEKFGGMEMDLISAMIVAEGVAKDGSYAAWHGAHAGIGTLPLLLFGTEDQKNRYLPRLASGEWIGAYCLSEPQAGSDAQASKTRADLSDDGTHFLLNGQKMWITNGGAADFYTVFAKIGGQQFTAFLVERSWAGVRAGAEEKKMGIKGSSTTPVYFDQVKVPVSNVLGEVGRGHKIAFNILNIGRLKLGPFTTGASRAVLGICIRYAKERKAFGKSIADFGMIQQKLAEMAIRLYATESMTYRVVGLVNEHITRGSHDSPDPAGTMLKAFEEYAAECSFVKVYASEALDFIVDEAVQIHGGYGYHQDYVVETAYRDSRINRIFEGTNEINRLLATGILLKRAQRGQLPLVEAVMKLQAEILGPPSAAAASSSSEELRLVSNAKKIALLLFGVAYQRFPGSLEEQQEVLAGITDVCMNALAMESALLRASKIRSEMAKDMTAVLLRESVDLIDTIARTVLSACAEGDTLRTHLAVLRRFSKYEPLNIIETRRNIARKLADAGKYVVHN